MLVAMALLGFQFSVFSPHKSQAAEKASQPAVAAEAVADSAVSSKSDSPTPSGKNEVLNDEKTEHDPVAFARGRLVAEPVPPVSSAPADLAAYPASAVAIERAQSCRSANRPPSQSPTTGKIGNGLP